MGKHVLWAILVLLFLTLPPTHDRPSLLSAVIDCLERIGK